MLMFRSPDRRSSPCSVHNNYEPWLARFVLGEGLETGRFHRRGQRRYIEAWSQPGALTGGLNYYRAARIGPPAPGDAIHRELLLHWYAVAQVNVPTLVIWGEKDTALLTGNLDGLDKYVTNLTIKRIPDGTHWVIHEKPALVEPY